MLNHGVSVIEPNLLLLGGTTEARELAKRLKASGIAAVVSLAGAVSAPKAQALPIRVGGFGGVDGLARYIRAHQVTHVVDATHPFAAQISLNALAACERTGTPLIALTRPPWIEGDGDGWTRVVSGEGAARALGQAPRRVMLGVGRNSFAPFLAHSHHWYLLRVVDPWTGPRPFPQGDVVVDRGPFDVDDDTALLKHHRVDVVVSKNSGGQGANAKIIAARQLGLPVIMIDRPAMPARQETDNAEDVLRWLGHGPTDRGV